MDWDYYETDVTLLTAVEIAFLVKQVDLIALLGQHAELTKDQTLNYVELMMRAKKEVPSKSSGSGLCLSRWTR